MGKINGYWRILKRNGELSKRKWVHASEMAKYANKVYGLGNWDYDYKDKDYFLNITMTAFRTNKKGEA